MFSFFRTRFYTCLSIILLCVYFILPNIFHGSSFFKSSPKMSYGLDIEGGLHMLLEIDKDEYYLDRYKLEEKVILLKLKERSVYVKGSASNKNGVVFNVLKSEIAEVQEFLGEMSGFLDYKSREVDGGLAEFALEFSAESKREIKDSLFAQSVEVVRNRVDQIGTKEISLQRQGENKIILQVPGLQDPEQLRRIIGKTAKMTFHLMNDKNPFTGVYNPFVAADELSLNGYQSDDRDGGQRQFFIIKKDPIIAGESLVDARALFDNGSGEPVVSFRFDAVGAKAFAKTTAENVGKPFAIVLDGKVVSAPYIREPILGGSGVISGNFTIEQVKELAILLKSGSLPAPIKIIEERVIGPSLGKDSVAKIKAAGFVSLLLVSVFMIAKYGVFGMFANIAILINILCVIAAMSLLQASLTLAGIAGIILTVGMAVDANILIFQRIIEEKMLAGGGTRGAVGSSAGTKGSGSVIAALDKGFAGAVATITDSNVTTFLAGLVLYILGGSLIKGFAVTLCLGVFSTIFSAVFCTKVMVELWYKALRPSDIPL